MDGTVRVPQDPPLETASLLETPPMGHDEQDGEEKDGYEGLPVVSDDGELLTLGICRVKLPDQLDADLWAEELSQVTPMILAFEGDGEYAFYRNILDEPDFPFDSILFAKRGNGEGKPCGGGDGLSEIGRSILRYFPIRPGTTTAADADPDPCGSLARELRLDDAFCVHYNMDQDDTSGAKHVDPSDITINMCLQKSKDARGSYVLFHGTKNLEEQPTQEEQQQQHLDNHHNSSQPRETSALNETVTVQDSSDTTDGERLTREDGRFLVPQRPGYATIHFGDHPHETTPLRRGSRTNIILTYLYTDPTRSDAATRSCY